MCDSGSASTTPASSVVTADVPPLRDQRYAERARCVRSGGCARHRCAVARGRTRRSPRARWAINAALPYARQFPQSSSSSFDRVAQCASLILPFDRFAQCANLSLTTHWFFGARFVQLSYTFEALILLVQRIQVERGIFPSSSAALCSNCALFVPLPFPCAYYGSRMDAFSLRIPVCARWNRTLCDWTHCISLFTTIHTSPSPSFPLQTTRPTHVQIAKSHVTFLHCVTSRSESA